MNYAEVAPLPASVADHLFSRFQARDEQAFVSVVHEKRRDTFEVLDAYVRAGALTRALVLDRLGLYGKTVAQTTFTNWQQRGLIEMERSGKPNPISAQALLISAMIDPGQRSFLPPGDAPAGDTWHCYIQRYQNAEIETCPVGQLDALPPSTLCWTRMRSASWVPGWHLIGESEGTLGCIRFAGARMVHGRTWYDVTLDDIRLWDAAVADLFVSLPGDTLAQIQVLCYPLFHRLAHGRLSERR